MDGFGTPEEFLIFRGKSRLIGAMKFLLRQKFWTLTEGYTIQDESGGTAFSVHGKAFSWGHQLSFRDASGAELIYIRQKLISWGPTYFLERDGRVYAEVRKHLFTLFRCKFTVDVPGPDDYEAVGDLLDMEYTFTRQERVVAEVSKRWFSWTDSYGIEIADGEDVPLLLASAVVIDLACHTQHHTS